MKDEIHPQRDPFKLGSLPELAPERDIWPAVEAALRAPHSMAPDQARSRARGWKLAAAGGALAASLTLVFTLQTKTVPIDTGTELAVSAQTGTAAPTLESMIDLSQRLEASLRQARARNGPMPTDALLLQVELEDLVAQVDDQLSRQPESLELWSQRINLLLDLSHLYRDTLRRDGARLASL